MKKCKKRFLLQYYSLILLFFVFSVIFITGCGSPPGKDSAKPYFVVLPYGGKEMIYSEDGNTWNKENLEVGDWMYFTGVCYGNGRFVAVTGGTSIFYSKEGIKWIEIQTVNNWRGICFGDDTFVAVGYELIFGTPYPRVAYSFDGVNWTSVALSGSNWNFQNVCYGNNRFVAMGDLNKIAYSSDGISWTEIIPPSLSSADWARICFGNGRFVIVAGTNSNKVAYSENGEVWVEKTMPTVAWKNSICYGNGKFVAVGSSGGYSAVAGKEAAYSDDGDTWHPATMPEDSHWNRVCYGNGKFVAISSNKAASSPNGEDWAPMVIPALTPPAMNWSCIAYGGDSRNLRLFASLKEKSSALLAYVTGKKFKLGF